MIDRHLDKWQQYHHFFESILISFCLTLFINDYFHLAIWPPLILIEVILFNGMLAVFDMSSKKLLSFFLGAGTIVFISLLTSYLKINLFTYASMTLLWLNNFSSPDALYIFHYAFSIILAASLVTSICFYPLQKFKVAKLFLMLGLFCALIFCCLQNIILSKWIIFLALTYNACVLTQLVYQLQSKIHFLHYKNASTFLLPFSILLALPILVLPCSKTPISWQFAIDFAKHIVATADNLLYQLQIGGNGENSEFGISLNGFNSSNNTPLGGKLTSNDTSLLYLSTRSTFKNPIYLKGSVYNVYTGQSWEKKNLPAIDSYNEYELDCYENLYGLYRSNLTTPQKVFRPVYVELNYDALRSSSLFWPNGTHHISQSDSHKVPNTTGANILFSKAQNKGLGYQLYFTESNINYLPLVNYLRTLDDFHYDNSNRTLSQLNFSLLPEDALFFQVYNPATKTFTDRQSFNSAIFNTKLESILSQRATLIDDAYTALPETLPKRVYTLAYDITKDAPTNYDKLKAIEAYLKQYKYTKTPGASPKDGDFVDDFLFNRHEGYCTYFASAMVVLARCVHIPTRYVEGFIVIPKGITNYNNDYHLTGADLHAWPEAYIEGYGWLTFEPTAGYSATSDASWAPKHTTDFSASSSSPIPTPTCPPGTNLTIVNSDLPEAHPENKTPLHVMLTIFSLLCLLVLLLIGYITYLALRYMRDIKKGTANQKAKLLFIEILFCLQKKGYQKVSSQSLIAFTESVSRNTFIAHGTTFSEIVNTYLAYRYGPHLVTDNELQTLLDYRHFLYDDTTGHLKRLKILMLKISFLLNGYKA